MDQNSTANGSKSMMDRSIPVQESWASFSSLPDEIWMKIIEKVPIAQWPSLESINRRFRGIVYETWNHISRIRIDDFVLKRRENVGDYQDVIDSFFRKLLLRAPKISSIGGFSESEHIEHRHTSISLLAGFQNLDHIEISGDLFNRLIYLEYFLRVSASRERLKYLEVDGHRLTRDFEAELRGTVDLPSMQLESFKGPSVMLRPQYLPLHLNLPSLKKLILVDHIDIDIGLNPIYFMELICQCRQIEHLEFEIPHCGNHQPSHDHIFQAVAALENLSILKMNISRSTYKKCPSLEEAILNLTKLLGCRHMTELAIPILIPKDKLGFNILSNMPDLKSLSLRIENSNISLLHLVTDLTNLETLHLQADSSSCVPHLDKDVIQAIGVNLKNLRRLAIDYPAFDLKEFSALADLPNLKELSIKTRKWDYGAKHFWKRCGFGAKLESLEFPIAFPWISSSELANFITLFPRIRRLRLSNDTNQILRAIATTCQSLIELVLTPEGPIDPQAIQMIIDRCDQLKILTIKESRNTGQFDYSGINLGKYRKIKFS